MKLSFPTNFQRVFCALACLGYLAHQVTPQLVTNSTAEDDTETLPDIISIAARAGSFDTLVTALGAADLVGALTFPGGPYTVFAPLDTAFEGLPSGLLVSLLDPAFSGILTDILLYHVVPGTLLAEDIVDGMNVTTLLGDTLTITLLNDTSVFVEDVPVIETNILASNGVIHAVAGVLLPSGLDINLLL